MNCPVCSDILSKQELIMNQIICGKCYDKGYRYEAKKEVEQNMKAYKVEDKMPNQKDLVLVEVEGVVIPAIYYKSLDGFFHFSLFYHTDKENVYKKAKIKTKHRIEGVTKWCYIPETL